MKRENSGKSRSLNFTLSWRSILPSDLESRLSRMESRQKEWITTVQSSVELRKLPPMRNLLPELRISQLMI